MKKKLLAAIIASELPKPCITLDLFKSEDRLRAYGGAAGGGKEYFWKTVGDSTPRHGAYKMPRNEKTMVWVDEAITVDCDRGRLRDWITESNPTPVIGFLANSLRLDPWKPATPEQIMEDIKNLFEKADK